MKKVLLIGILFLNLSLYGQKFYINADLGYSITNILGYGYITQFSLPLPEIGFGYRLSTKFNVELKINELYYSKTYDSLNYSSMRMTRFMLMLKYLISSKYFSFYLKAGPSFGIGCNILYADAGWTDYNPPTYEYEKQEYSGGFTYGYALATGAEWVIGNRLEFYTELFGISNTWDRSHSNFIHNASFPIGDYVDRSSVIFNSLGINIGLKYSF